MKVKIDLNKIDLKDVYVRKFNYKQIPIIVLQNENIKYEGGVVHLPLGNEDIVYDCHTGKPVAIIDDNGYFSSDDNERQIIGYYDPVWERLAIIDSNGAIHTIERAYKNSPIPLNFDFVELGSDTYIVIRIYNKYDEKLFIKIA